MISSNSASNGGGVYCPSSSSPTLSGCTISGNQYNGVYCAGSRCTLTNCVIANNIGAGVFAVLSFSLRLTGCVIAHNTENGIDLESWGVGSLALTNCTVVENAGIGLVWRTSITGEVKNTILAFNKNGGIRSETGGDVRLYNNCIWGNTPYNVGGHLGNPIGTNGNISVDPLLVAWHLLPDSPCIDAGTGGMVNLDTDIDGDVRVVNGVVDIGADEFLPPIVHGYLQLNDFRGDVPLTVDCEMRGSGIQIGTLWLDANGDFVVPGVPMEQFALSVKPLSYLRRTVEVDTSEGSVLGLQISLVNGDIDDDNEVTLFDFGALVAAFGSAPGDGNWNPRADLDGDGEVTLFDFGVIVRNFGEIGDE